MSEIRIPGATYGCGISHEDRVALEEKASTDVIVAKAAASAGRKGGALPLGTEPTYRQTKASQQPLANWKHDAIHIGIGTVHSGIEIAEVFLEAAGPRVANTASTLAGVTAMVETAKMLPRAWVHGDEQNVALQKDERRLAITFSLVGLPASFVQGEIDKRKEVTGKYQSPADVIAFKLRQDKAAVAVLQLRADEGMKVAEQCIAAQLSRESFFKTRPDLARRYAVDAAFQIGFDAFLHAQAAGPSMLDKTLTELRKRDARCGATFDLVFTG